MLNEGISIRHMQYFITALIGVFVCGLFVDMMDVDATQYASISREMTENGSYLAVKNHGVDYLDKPPLLFWLSSFSFSVFGFHNWSYKLPSFLFGLLGIWSTYGLGKFYYGRATGALAAVVLSSTVAFFIIHNDIRTDTLLFGSVMFAIWQLQLWVKTKRWLYLFAGFIGIGLAMLAKGPLGLMMPVLTLSCEFAYKRQWRNFFRWQWLIGLAVVALMLWPMCLGLYKQYGTRGLYFYFWEQSFGRLTGDSPWGTKFDNGAGPFFFVHTFFWAFLPWGVVFVLAAWKNGIMLLRSRFREGYIPELATLGGFLLTFVALSASKYKLPHYIYVTFPLASILTARYLVQEVLPHKKERLYKAIRILFSVQAVLFTIVLLLALAYIFGYANWAIWVAGIAGLLIGGYFSRKAADDTQRLLYPMLCVLIATYAVGNLQFYPKLLTYQSTTVAGKKITEMNIPRGAFYIYGGYFFEHSLDYNSRRSVTFIDLDNTSQLDTIFAKHKTIWIYTDKAAADTLHGPFKVGQKLFYPHFGVQNLTIPFLDPNTRESTLRQRCLVELKRD